MAELSLVIDHAQKRIRFDRQATILDGTSWRTDFNLQYQRNTWIDSETRTAILRPNVMEPEFDTTFTGRFKRFAKSDYSLISPSAWRDVEGGRGSGDIWLESDGVVNEPVVTASSWKADQGFYLSWFAYNANISKASMIECGWFRKPSGTDGIVTFRFLSGGYVDVYYNDTFQRTYTLARRKDVEEGNERGEQQQQEFTDVMLMPWRNREIMILPKGGEPVVHVIDGLAESNRDPVIPAGAYFAWRVRDTQAKVQLCPVLFREPAVPGDGAPTPNEAFACAVPTTFLEPPRPEADLEVRAIYYASADGDYVSARLRNLSNTANYDATGSLNSVDAVIRVDFLRQPVGGDTQLWGGETAYVRTPYAYGAEAAFQPVPVPTPSAETDILPEVTEIRLQVERDTPMSTLTFVVREPAQFETEHPHFTALDFRPLQLRLGDIVVFDGVCGDISERDAPHDAAKRGEFRARDLWTFFETYMTSDVIPCDGLTLTDAIEKLARTAIPGIAVSLTDEDFTIPAPGTDRNGNFITIVDVGETIADGINRLHEAFAGNWMYGFRPRTGAMEFFFEDPEQMDATPSVTLHRTIQDAEVEFPGEGVRHVYRSLKLEPAPMEVTEIWIQGFDPFTGKPRLAQVAHVEDPDDPETDVLARTEIWKGYPAKYSFSAKELSSKELLLRAARLLARRLMRKRTFVEFEAEFQVKSDSTPIWRGDVVNLAGVGTVRILALQGSFVKEPRGEFSDDWQWRPFTYAGELLTREGE